MMMMKKKISPKNKFQNLCNKHPKIWMGIINLTDQSFSDCLAYSKHLKANNFEFSEKKLEHILQEAKIHIKNGAQILDIGGVPSNPGVENALFDPNLELKILEPALTFLKAEISSETLFSVDTYSPQVAYFLAKKGLIDVVNDIYGSRKTEKFYDETWEHKHIISINMMDVVAKFSLGYILMHMFGDLDKLPDKKSFKTVQSCRKEIINFFSAKKLELERKEIDFCVFDPGVGGGRFGKNQEQNLMLISKDFLNEMMQFGFPLLVGLSRKGFLNDIYPDLLTPESRDSVSKIYEKNCFKYGVQIIRSHKVL